MKRKFYSGPNCPFRCQYCFAGFADYRRQEPFDVRSMSSDADIFYPSCDGEAVISSTMLTAIYRAIRGGHRNAVISISTKAPISTAALHHLAEINRCLEDDGRGFVKVSVSLPTKYLIADIEPGTAPYGTRLRNLEELSKLGIKTSVNLRPMLPFVPVKEYREIIEDTVEISARYLVGPLYVDITSPFFNRWIKGRYQTTLRRAVWASGQPLWHSVQDDGQKAAVAEIIRHSGGRVFESDDEVIVDLCDSQTSKAAVHSAVA